MDVEVLREWFLEEKREFPWRTDPSPYKVWISEVMLQQTQAAVVIPYFEKWMAKFPTIEALSSATLEEVMKTWEGLGYYSRARNLHLSAKYLVENEEGKLPDNAAALLKIKGIGLYTAAAILSFAYRQKSAAVDGNVMRVIARLFCIEEPISSLSVQHRIRELTLSYLPDEQPWVVMEALIELGAQICMKKAACERCPLQDSCLAFERGKVELLPNRGKRSAVTSLIRFVPVIQHEDYYLLQQGREGKVMAGLYEFPYLEGKKKVSVDEMEQHFGLNLVFKKKLAKVKHAFTSFRAELFPSLWQAKKRVPIADYVWVQKEAALQLPFSSGHRRILTQLMD